MPRELAHFTIVTVHHNPTTSVMNRLVVPELPGRRAANGSPAGARRLAGRKVWVDGAVTVTDRGDGSRCRPEPPGARGHDLRQDGQRDLCGLVDQPRADTMTVRASVTGPSPTINSFAESAMPSLSPSGRLSQVIAGPSRRLGHSTHGNERAVAAGLDRRRTGRDLRQPCRQHRHIPRVQKRHRPTHRSLALSPGSCPLVRRFYYPLIAHERYGVPKGLGPHLVLIDAIGDHLWLSGPSCGPGDGAAAGHDGARGTRPPPPGMGRRRPACVAGPDDEMHWYAKPT